MKRERDDKDKEIDLLYSVEKLTFFSSSYSIFMEGINALNMRCCINFLYRADE